MHARHHTVVSIICAIYNPSTLTRTLLPCNDFVSGPITLAAGRRLMRQLLQNILASGIGELQENGTSGDNITKLIQKYDVKLGASLVLSLNLVGAAHEVTVLRYFMYGDVVLVYHVSVPTTCHRRDGTGYQTRKIRGRPGYLDVFCFGKASRNGRPKIVIRTKYNLIKADRKIRLGYGSFRQRWVYVEQLKGKKWILYQPYRVFMMDFQALLGVFLVRCRRCRVDSYRGTQSRVTGSVSHRGRKSIEESGSCCGKANFKARARSVRG